MSGTTGTESQNLEVMKRGYEAFAKGDVATLKTLFAADAIWNQTETGVLPGNYKGAQAILEYFGMLAHESQGSLRVVPQTMAASGDLVFVLERVTGTRKGRTLDTTDVLVFKLNNGVVTEVSYFPSDHPVYVQFWS